jgi:small subunit ribosomal protein S14
MLKFTEKNNKQRSKLFNSELVDRTKKILYTLVNKKEYPSKVFIRKYLLNLRRFDKPSSSPTRLRSVCFLTGRSRSVYRTFKMSRLEIKKYANMGFFVGMSKSS